jgi:hypothetical protein
MSTSWIGPVLGAVAGVILAQLFAWYKTRKGDKLVVRRTSQTNEINVSPSIQKDLEIKYKGVIASQLVVNTFEVFNDGESNLQDIEFSLGFDSVGAEAFFVTPEVSDYAGQTKVVSNAKDSPARVVIKRTYLNKLVAHKKEKILVSLISNALLKVEVSGGGPGWSVVYEDAVTKNRTSYFRYGILAIVTGVLFAMLISKFGIEGSGPSDYFATFFVVLCIVLVTFIMETKQLRK